MKPSTLYWVVLIMSVLLVLIVIPRFYFYTPHGDINNFYHEKINHKMSQYELVEELYELCIFDYCKVRWHYTFTLSLFSSILVLYLLNCFNLRNVIILTLAFFIVIEVPNRLENGHIKNSTANKATLLFGALSDRLQNCDSSGDSSVNLSKNSESL